MRGCRRNAAFRPLAWGHEMAGRVPGSRMDGRLGGAAMLFAALLLAACTASPSALGPQATASLSGKTAEAPMPADVLREHQRILAAYGGIYVEARLQSLLERTVERLVGASQK